MTDSKKEPTRIYLECSETSANTMRTGIQRVVRNTILQLRGIDTYQEFVQRQRYAMEHPSQPGTLANEG